jgi:hypothetical protein
MTVKDHVLDPQEIHIIKSSSGRHLGMGNDLLNLVEWIDLYNLYIMTDTVSCHQVSRGPVCLRATICPVDEAQTLAIRCLPRHRCFDARPGRNHPNQTCLDDISSCGWLGNLEYT